MILKKIQVQEFRSLGDITFDVDRLNIIVGANDSGKSNILRAIKAFAQPDTAFIDADRSTFHHFAGSGKVNDYPITITCEFDGLNIIESASVKKIHTEFRAINRIVRTDESYELDFSSAGTRGVVESTKIAFNKSLQNILPKVVSIDLSEAYSSFSDGRIGDLEAKINEMLMKRTSREDKKLFKNNVDAFLKDYWNSDTLSSISITTDEGGVEIECKDAYRINSGLGQRGTGFQAFLFLALSLLDAINENSSEMRDLVFLIEEPERMLHPQGQVDFIRLVRQFIEDNKSITAFITTHSPTIVRADRKANVLLVQKAKNGDGRSEIVKKPHINNWKVFRDALGIRPSDSMLVGDISVIVEGACEQIYIPKLIEKFYEVLKLDFDISVFSFVSAEGVSNIPFYVRILKNMNTKVFAVFDNDARGRKEIERLKSAKLLDDKQLHIYKAEDDRDISFEDLFPPETLFEAVIHIYSSQLTKLSISISNESFIAFRDDQIRERSNYANGCWSRRMSDYLLQSKVIDDKDDFDKFSICDYCVDAIQECPVEIASLSRKLSAIARKR